MNALSTSCVTAVASRVSLRPGAEEPFARWQADADPDAIAGLGWWLHPPPERRRAVEILGVAAVLGLYAVELAIFTWLY